MGRETNIEWTDHTFNPWWGCERVSPACAHCYAATFARRTGHADTWSSSGDHAFRFFGDKHWNEPRIWNAHAAETGTRERVFCASMADVFEDRAELAQPRLRLLTLIEETPHLDWQLLTKRPEFMRDWLAHWYDGPLAPNIWVGTSIENSRYTWRADVLREIPAHIRFISAEPLLGSLFEGTRTGDRTRQGSRSSLAPEGSAQTPGTRAPLDLTGIDWIICGGESGHGYRPMNLDHARELRDACLAGCKDCAALTAKWMPDAHEGPGFEDGHTHWSPCRRPAFFFKQVGGPTPKAGGKLLDGREWCELSEPDLIPA